MRGFVCASILAITATLAMAASQGVTVDQLRQAIQAHLSAHEGDEALARYLNGLQLNQQLTQSSRDAILSSNQLGPRATLELGLLADASAFLEPPPSEAPARAVPDAASQQTMLNAAVHYVADTFKRLPNFTAKRRTRSFDDTPLVVTHSGWSPSNSELHLAGTFEQEVTYRNDREYALGARTEPTVDTRRGAPPPGLTSAGEFGPILITVLTDVSKGSIAWDRWEKTDSGFAAVFRFEVPALSSHYEVSFCCVRSSENPSSFGLGGPGGSDQDNSYRGTPAYHGTITLDPGSGTILRITIDPELKEDGPISRSAIAVDYGPVEIGGRTYMCPVRSIALSKARTRLGGDMSDRTVLRINEVTFTDYHRFGATSRIVENGGEQ